MSFYTKLLKKTKKFIKQGISGEGSRKLISSIPIEKRELVKQVSPPIMGMAKGLSPATKGLRSAYRKISRESGRTLFKSPSELSNILKSSIKHQIRTGADPRGGGKFFRPELRKEYTKILRKLLKK